MNYLEFREYMVENIGEHLPPQYSDCEITVMPIPKLNGYRESIVISQGTPMEPIPNLYVDDLFDIYKKSGSAESAIEYAVDLFVYGKSAAENMGADALTTIKKDHIILMLMNTGSNKKMLRDVPHREILDLSIIYRYMLPLPDGSCNLLTISNAMLDMLELTEEEMFDLALENTQRLLPLEIRDLGSNILVLTNEKGMLGAAVMMYEGTLDTLTDLYDSDFYLIPSSIHEMIAVPVNEDVRESYLKDLISDANRNVLMPTDVLSDTLYYYRCSDGRIVAAEEAQVRS